MVNPEAAQANPDVLDLHEADLLLNDYYTSRAEEIRADAVGRGLDDRQAAMEIRHRLDEPASRVAEVANSVGETMGGQVEVGQISGEMGAWWMRRQRDELAQKPNGAEQYVELDRYRNYLTRLSNEPGLARQKVEAIKTAQAEAEHAREGVVFNRTDIQDMLDGYADERLEKLEQEDKNSETGGLDAALERITPIVSVSESPKEVLDMLAVKEWQDANIGNLTAEQSAEFRALANLLRTMDERPEEAAAKLAQYRRREEQRQAQDAEEAEREAMVRDARDKLANVHISGELSNPRTPRNESHEDRPAAEAVNDKEYDSLPPYLKAQVDRIRGGALTHEQREANYAESSRLAGVIHNGDDEAREVAREQRKQLQQQRFAGDFETRNPDELYRVMAGLGFEPARIDAVAQRVAADAARHQGRPPKITITFSRASDGEMDHGLFGFSR